MSGAVTGTIENGDWPIFGWADDIRPALAESVAAGRPAVLATLFRVGGSAPRGPGAQMLFTPGVNGAVAVSGYFSGDCIEGDVTGHAAQVLTDGRPRRLHYGTGSPWIDIRLRCGGALFVMLERIAPGSAAVADLLRHARERRPCLWDSDGRAATVREDGGPLLAYTEEPLRIVRRYDPPRRLIVSGGDPGALAAAQLGALARFETILVRPQGPEAPPPFPVSQYLRCAPAEALQTLGIDRWTAYLGATHEDEHDLGGCLAALRGGAGYTGMIGAKSRAPGRLAALQALGATPEELNRLHLSPGITGLGKSPWEVATGIVAEIMQALNPASERA
ncbi:MAG: XdhC family protein [Novosphingobium sp.]